MAALSCYEMLCFWNIAIMFCTNFIGQAIIPLTCFRTNTEIKQHKNDINLFFA